MTGRVDILWHIFEKIFKNSVTGPKNKLLFCTFLILSFMKFCVAQTFFIDLHIVDVLEVLLVVD